MTIRQATAAIAYDDLAALLDDWQISLKAKGRRPGTISSYLTVARTFNAFLLTLAAQGSRPRCSDPIDHNAGPATATDRGNHGKICLSFKL